MAGSTGTYIVGVGGSAASTGPYLLKVTVGAGPATYSDANAAFATATPLDNALGSLDRAVRPNGGISSATDIDMYAVTLTANETLTVDLNASYPTLPTRGLDGKVQVLAPITPCSARPARRGSPDALLQVTAPATTVTGTYYIEISDSGGQTHGDYTMTVEVSPSSPSPASDAGNTMAGAVDIDPLMFNSRHEAIYESLSPITGDPADFYKFTLNAGEILTAAVSTNPAASTLDSNLSLYRVIGTGASTQYVLT